MVQCNSNHHGFTNHNAFLGILRAKVKFSILSLWVWLKIAPQISRFQILISHELAGMTYGQTSRTILTPISFQSSSQKFWSSGGMPWFWGTVFFLVCLSVCYFFVLFIHSHVFFGKGSSLFSAQTHYISQ